MPAMKNFSVGPKLAFQRFESEPQAYKIFSCFGTQIVAIQPSTIKIIKPHYIAALRTLTINSEINPFRKARASLARVLHSRL